MSEFDAQLPVRALAANFTTEVANATGTTINPAEDYAQGSTTSGQNGVLAQGAVTTAAPTYTTGQTNPLSLNTSGGLRVDGSGVTQPVSGTVTANQGTANATPWNENVAQWGGVATSLGQKVMASSVPVVIASDQSPINVVIDGGTTSVMTYFTDAAVAAGATVTHSVAGPVTLEAIHSAGSGMIKMNVATGTTGSETDKWVGFTSAAHQNMEFDTERDIVIPTGQSVKVTLKNRDTNAQDLYLTFFTH
jgi:hypothetical protein